VLAASPPAGNDVEAFIQLGDDGGNVRRIVLKIRIERNDDAAFRMVDSRRERRRLAEVPPQMNDPDVRLFRKIVENRARAVGGTIVDEDEFERTAPGGQRVFKLVVELAERIRFVENGQNDRNKAWIVGTRRLVFSLQSDSPSHPAHRDT